MKVHTKWKEKMEFIGGFSHESGEESPFTVALDARSPIGTGQGFTPKELVALGVAGCTAMDVAALMKKYAQKVDSFNVDVNFTLTKGITPTVFQTMDLTFTLTGSIDKEKALEAVRLSQTKYCGVTAMISKTVPIHYKVIVNSEEVGTGQASFA